MPASPFPAASSARDATGCEPMPRRRPLAMTRDRVFVATAARASDFVFDDEVAVAFDDMVARSVPFYREQQQMLTEWARKFWIAEFAGTSSVRLGRTVREGPVVVADVIAPLASVKLKSSTTDPATFRGHLVGAKVTVGSGASISAE